MTKEMETTMPHKQTKQSTMAHYIDGFVIPLPKHKIDEYRRIAEKSGESSETMTPWNIGNGPAKTSPSKVRYRSRLCASANPTRPWFLRGSSSSHERILTKSTPR